MKSSKRKIIIGGIALLAYVAHVLTAALDSKPGDVSKAQFVVQLGADKRALPIMSLSLRSRPVRAPS